MQIFNPTEEMLLEDGWVEQVPVVHKISEENMLKTEKINLKDMIERYDSSEDVNIFYVNDTPIWLDKATRSGLMLRFQAEIASGKTNTSLWYNGIDFTLTLDIAVQMLYAIEIYASECYDNTQRHLAEVDNITDPEDIKQYDYKAGYPEKLSFKTCKIE